LLNLPAIPRGCPVSLTLIVINIGLYLAQMSTGNLITNSGLL